MKVLHIAYTDTSGGAAIATRRLVDALNSRGIKSDILVRIKKTDNNSVIGPKNLIVMMYNRLRYTLGQLLYKVSKESNPCLHSINFIPSFWHKYINESNYDIVHLHWIGGETISFADLSKINKPVIWTFHDMWPFCGSEHLNDMNESAPWIVGYKKNKLIDWNKNTWMRKKKFFKKININVIAPSKWMEDCALNSDLFKNSNIRRIPNFIDTSIYKKIDKAFSRKVLNIANNKFVILFGAIGGTADGNKGFSFLLQALEFLQIDKSKVVCVIFGQSKPQTDYNIPFEVKWLGFLNDDVSLTIAYNAASVLVVPSRIDTFPSTATEAQSCGCPVVAFNTTGLSSIVEHKYSGYLAAPFNTEDLAAGLKWVYENENDLSENCVGNATNKWDPAYVLSEHLDFYKEVLDKNGS